MEQNGFLENGRKVNVMKLWIDDVRPAPDESWVWLRTVEQAKAQIAECEYMRRCSRDKNFWTIELISIDHDAGDYADCGGDYIEVLNWMEKNKYRAPIRLHSMNPVGVQNMRAIIQKNHWTEVPR